MNRDDYENLVKRLEAKSISAPESYKSGVRLFSALGYAYFTVLLLFGIAMIALGLLIVWGMIAGGRVSGGGIKIALALILCFGVLVVTMLRSMWLKYPEPEGQLLKPGECPRLFELIHSLEERLQARPIDRVIVTPELNAAILQNARFGPFGTGHSYLILGLPLMQALDPDEFRAVVAHEFGHHSGNHSAFAGKIYRSRNTWRRFVELHFAQSQGGGGGFGNSFIVKFLQWYFPRFDARAFVLARQNEYEADRCAAEVAGADKAIRALVRINLAAERAEKSFWNLLTKEMEQAEEPPHDIYFRYGKFLRDIPLDEVSADIIDRGVKHPTDYSDTHPCLADRAASLGLEIRGRAGELSALARRLSESEASASDHIDALIPRPLKRSSAEEFLGPQEEKLAEHFSQQWKDQVQGLWKEDAGKMREGRERLAALIAEERADAKTLLEKAVLVERFEGAEAGMKLYRQALLQEPDNAIAHIHVGRLLLEARNEEGIMHMEEAIRLNVRLTPPACELAIGFLRGEGRAEEERPWLKRYDDFQELAHQAEQERENILPKDHYLPPSLSKETIDQIVSAAVQEEGVRKISIIRKEMRIFADEPVHVVVVDVKAKLLQNASDAAASTIATRIIARLQIEDVLYVIIPWESMKPWKKSADKVPGAVVYVAGE